MDKANLGLKQVGDKLQGGFSVLSTAKLSRINGGNNEPNRICSNRSTSCNTTNSQVCTNYGVPNCQFSTNTIREACKLIP